MVHWTSSFPRLPYRNWASLARVLNTEHWTRKRIHFEKVCFSRFGTSLSKQTFITFVVRKVECHSAFNVCSVHVCVCGFCWFCEFCSTTSSHIKKNRYFENRSFLCFIWNNNNNWFIIGLIEFVEQWPESICIFVKQINGTSSSVESVCSIQIYHGENWINRIFKWPHNDNICANNYAPITMHLNYTISSSQIQMQIQLSHHWRYIKCNFFFYFPQKDATLPTSIWFKEILHHWNGSRKRITRYYYRWPTAINATKSDLCVHE